MVRALISFFAGCAIVALVTWFGQQGTYSHVAHLLLAPGIVAGGLTPDAGVDLDHDTRLWGPISTIVLYAVNIAVYAVLIYALLTLFSRLRKASK